MRGRKFVRMGAVLLMLLALVLPVAPAGAAGAVQDEDATTVTASNLTPFVFDDCLSSPNNQTRYFLTLVSSTGTNIPAVNGGVPATVTLIGAGTQNKGQTVAMPVGDLESQAFTGVDTAAPTPPVPNGSCNDTGDTPALLNDSRANDYGSQYVPTSLPIGTPIAGLAAGLVPGANVWDVLITAPGHVAQLIKYTEFLVDGMPAPGAIPGLVGFGGLGCLRIDRGCLVSIGTITLQALTVPNAGRGSISGTIRDINGLPLGGVELVIYRQPDQDPTNDATLPIAENQAFSILTDPLTGQYFVGNLWPGRYSVTLADTRFPVACALNANCGVQPATKIANVFPTGAVPGPNFDPNSNQQVTVDFSVPTDLVAQQAPGTVVGTTLAGIFGYVVDGSTGMRIGSLVPGTLGFNPNGGNGSGLGTAAPVNIVFTPTQPGACVGGLNPAGGNSPCIGTVTATTDANGRYQAVLVAGVAYVAQVTGFNQTATIGILPVGNLPLGYTGACTVGGNDPTVAFPGALFQCTSGINGTDRFQIGATGATSLTAGAWNASGTFVLAPSNATQIGPGNNGSGVVRRLEATIPGVFRNPDTSYTGVDVETVQVRVMNNGVQRTGAQIEWYSTSSDDVASLVKTDTLDLNSGAVGIFTRAIIPDGCTRCMAQIYSLDLDAQTPPNIPGLLPSNTPGIPGINGFVYGLSDLQATVTHRVVDAGNALAGGNAISFEDMFPTGQTNNSGYIIPLIYKNYGGGVNKWTSILTACLTRGVPGPQPVVFEFMASGESRGGPYQITRSTNPGGCIVLNMATFDPNDPDYYDPLAGIPDGTYSVVVTSTAGNPIPTPPEVPGGFFASSLSYSTTGRMATLGNGYIALSAESQVGGIREMYAPLIFKRYNDWNSGIAITGYRPRTSFGFNSPFSLTGGGSGSGASLAVYGEDGTLMGIFLDSISRSNGGRIYYLPTLPIQLPDGFRGSMIAATGDNTAGSRMAGSVQTVNYERNQAMSYNFISQDTVTGIPTPNARPCNYQQASTTDPETQPLGPPNVLSPLGTIPNPTTYIACLTVPDAQRRFSGAPRGTSATFEVGLGPTTGIRLFNPDPFKNGAPSYVMASYLDSAGIVFVGSFTAFSIPAYHTATIFMGSDTQLPDIYDGSMFIQTSSPIAGIANVVDYRVTDRDASYAYNLPNQTGRSQ